MSTQTKPQYNPTMLMEYSIEELHGFLPGLLASNDPAVKAQARFAQQVLNLREGQARTVESRKERQTGFAPLTFNGDGRAVLQLFTRFGSPKFTEQVITPSELQGTDEETRRKFITNSLLDEIEDACKRARAANLIDNPRFNRWDARAKDIHRSERIEKATTQIRILANQTEKAIGSLLPVHRPLVEPSLRMSQYEEYTGILTACEVTESDIPESLRLSKPAPVTVDEGQPANETPNEPANTTANNRTKK